jgi:hypothetical protein
LEVPADDTFQPVSAEELLRPAHDHLCNTLLGFRDTYKYPSESRMNGAIAKTETAWDEFGRLRLNKDPAGECYGGQSAGESDGSPRSDSDSDGIDDVDVASGGDSAWQLRRPLRKPPSPPLSRR